MQAIEQRIAKTVIKTMLGAGYSISVWEGEAYAIADNWTAVRGTDPDKIFKALASTDQDTLYAIDASGKAVGSVWFIYGNGEDLIVDCSDNIDALISPAVQKEFFG